MATSSSFKFTSVDLEKLNELRSALLEGIRKCGEVVLSVSNEPLKKTILTLEQQSNQYANELNSQIQVLGGYEQFKQEEDKKNISIKSNRKKLDIEKQALSICRKVEKTVISLYQKLLDEDLKNESLRKMIKYQMDGIMRTTLQLKLLSKFLHNQ